MSREHKREVLQGLGVIRPDRRMAEFYASEVIDNNASSGEAKQLATAEAKKIGLATGSIIDPDFSISNLKRLGAKQVMKEVIYIKIQHLGEKDVKSRLVTDEDKITFKQAWEKFNEKRCKEIPAQAGKIREQRNYISDDTSRPQYQNPQKTH